MNAAPNPYSSQVSQQVPVVRILPAAFSPEGVVKFLNVLYVTVKSLQPISHSLKDCQEKLSRLTSRQSQL